MSYEAYQGTRPVAEAHRFDVAHLERYMRDNVEGFSGALAVEQFKGGQSNPTYRLSAGGKVAEDVLKCQLKPVSSSDYAPATLTASQMARLMAVFPGGVCDFSKSGVNQKPAAGPFTFQAGPFGQPLGAAPASGP